MPGLIKRGRVWYSDIRIGGKRVRKPLSRDKVVAQQKLREMSDSRHAQKYGLSGSIPWDAFKDKFLEWSKGTKEQYTYERDKASISALEAFFRPKRLSDITPELLDRFKAHRKSQNKGNATVNTDLKKLKAMMAKAMEWRYIEGWDARTVKRLKEVRGRLLFYTPQELKRLLGVCQTRMSGYYDWETVCRLASRAGLRRSEIYWLSWADVDLNRGIVSVVPKAGWAPKGKEQRHIPVPKDLHKHLQALHRKKQTEWVIGERPSKAVLSAFFQKISRKAKLKGNLHTLRHTYASHLVQAGVPLYTVQKLLGHSSIKTTEIYAHLAPENLQDAVNKLPNLD